MAERARVHESEALRQARAALLEFSDAALVAISSVNAEIMKVSEWLRMDRPAHWKKQVRKGEDEVAAAKSAIMRKRIISAPEPAPIVDEQKALRKAERKLEHARQKLAATQRWLPVWEKEASLYQASCHGLAETIRREIPIAVGKLDRMLSSLEAYAKMTPPASEGAPRTVEGDQSAAHDSGDATGDGSDAGADGEGGSA
ncbi:MAG: hypothetical protein JNM80_08025 [Phycisphaerae bacterium]|nr:hypothetical protein [Phycisphaerae bacterium]